MKRFTATLLACAFGIGAASAQDANPPATATQYQDETITPAPGDYKLVEMFLDGMPARPEGTSDPRVVRGAFRDGTLRLVQCNNWKKYRAELAVTDDSIKGLMVWQPVNADFTFQIDATIKDGVISGTWELVKKPASQIEGPKYHHGNYMGDVSKGAIRGTVKTEAELAKANALPKGKDWPQYYGPNNGSFAVAPSGLALVTDPKDIRYAWRSEEFTAQGQGNACHCPGYA